MSRRECPCAERGPLLASGQKRYVPGHVLGGHPQGADTEAVPWRVVDLLAELMVAEIVAAGHAVYLCLHPGVGYARLRPGNAPQLDQAEHVIRIVVGGSVAVIIPFRAWVRWLLDYKRAVRDGGRER